ncbi:Ups1p KNAG_0B02550 [Huiozyma naganishii CBS 8797]|uniref:PRELI/MSF1 domain-containing protein n=1 Tax=Huiozyma naganishii (strain ATCC MYA-139 / BCRC 22969 / CBS 8797 / KCTC 17520 / NBRC 10181 / NCYC 3082 / Yp74L-3) TaxID=1071383 RepID=J7RUZ2_HUIN7|nr:hypothetical protein KNAG_0B02550 [Kazachstania naganishii CBS 8797]CCK68697.1 hypothetical protein KNAG_0B02550 [Kazachstania naganishii CBS 8797]
MVLLHCNRDTFNSDFDCVTSVVFNKYPNPYATHILSTDVIDRHLDRRGDVLFTTRLIRKQGRLPGWVQWIVGGVKISDSWMIEYSRVDRRRKVLTTYARNLDHTRVLKVEERTTYEYLPDRRATSVHSEVTFTSGLNGIKHKIEALARAKFEESVKRSREGMSLVMQKIEAAAERVAAISVAQAQAQAQAQCQTQPPQPQQSQELI